MEQPYRQENLIYKDTHSRLDQFCLNFLVKGKEEVDVSRCAEEFLGRPVDNRET